MTSEGIAAAEILNLERLAREASPGPWDAPAGTCEVFGANGRLVALTHSHFSERPEVHHEADARFVAALNPQRVLQLLELVRSRQGDGASPRADAAEPSAAPALSPSTGLPTARCPRCSWQRSPVHDDDMRCAVVAFELGAHLQEAHRVERLDAISSAARWLVSAMGSAAPRPAAEEMDKLW